MSRKKRGTEQRRGYEKWGYMRCREALHEIGVGGLVVFDVGFVGWLAFFFFQAEDGIRDRDVTGAQTCALPISACLAEEAIGTDLRLPAADRPAAARPAAGVDREVADLAAIAGDARKGLAIDDEPPADADLAGHEQDVVDSGADTTARLGQRAEVRLV